MFRNQPSGSKGKGLLLAIAAVAAVFVLIIQPYIKSQQGSPAPALPQAEKEQKITTLSSSFVSQSSSSDIRSEKFIPADRKGLDEELYYYYSLLEPEEQIVYEELLAWIEAGKDTAMTPSYKLPAETIINISNYITCDQPQLFWYEGRITYTYNKKTNLVSGILPRYNELAKDLEKNRQLVEDKVETLLQEASELSDPEAEKFFYDYLCQNITYQAGDNDQNIYSAFVEGSTVCSGYTRALQYLMLRRGVPCYYCQGDSYDIRIEDYGPHAWNIIKLNDSYYNCDVTYGDFYNEADKYPSYVSYAHFNVTDEQLASDRYRDEWGSMLPACEQTEMNYNTCYGTDWEYTLPQQLNTDCTYVIDSLDAFYDFCYNWLVTYGAGSHNISFIVRGKDVCEQIANLTGEQLRDYVAQPAADALSFRWSSANWTYHYWTLPGENYCYFEFQLDFS